MSGAALLAAVNPLGQRCYALEIEPRHCQVSFLATQRFVVGVVLRGAARQYIAGVPRPIHPTPRS